LRWDSTPRSPSVVPRGTRLSDPASPHWRPAVQFDMDQRLRLFLRHWLIDDFLETMPRLRVPPLGLGTSARRLHKKTATGFSQRLSFHTSARFLDRQDFLRHIRSGRWSRISANNALGRVAVSMRFAMERLWLGPRCNYVSRGTVFSRKRRVVTFVDEGGHAG
jgi:hypothetical protein